MAELLTPNTPAPDFTLSDGDGNVFKLSDYRGKNVMLAFYPSDWSSVCTNQLSIYQEHLKQIRSHNAEVLAISVDGRESHKAWASQQGITFPLLSDFWPHGAVAEQYGVFWPNVGISNRALFFIDVDGIIRHTWVGEHPGKSPDLDVVFNSLKQLHETQQ